MKLETFTITQILTVLTSTGFGAFITHLANRRKTNADALLAKAQTKLTEIEIYSSLVGDLKTQVEMLQHQVLALQGQNAEYLKIINSQNRNERSLQKRIKQLENELSDLKQQLKP